MPFFAGESHAELLAGPLLVWGCSGHARVLLDIIAVRGGRVVAFVDAVVGQSLIDGVPVLDGHVEWQEWRKAHYHQWPTLGGVVAIGRQGGHRLQIQGLWQAAGIVLPSLVHPSASVSPQARLGQGTQVLAMAVVAADAHVADVCIINHHASIDHECVLEPGVMVAPGATLCGNVWVGEDAFVGAGATVLPRIRIGRRAMVGAGAVVTRDVPDDAVVVGSPARMLPQRSRSPGF